MKVLSAIVFLMFVGSLNTANATLLVFNPAQPVFVGSGAEFVPVCDTVSDENGEPVEVCHNVVLQPYSQPVGSYYQCFNGFCEWTTWSPGVQVFIPVLAPTYFLPYYVWGPQWRVNCWGGWYGSATNWGYYGYGGPGYFDHHRWGFAGGRVPLAVPYGARIGNPRSNFGNGMPAQYRNTAQFRGNTNPANFGNRVNPAFNHSPQFNQFQRPEIRQGNLRPGNLGNPNFNRPVEGYRPQPNYRPQPQFQAPAPQFRGPGPQFQGPIAHAPPDFRGGAPVGGRPHH